MAPPKKMGNGGSIFDGQTDLHLHSQMSECWGGMSDNDGSKTGVLEELPH